MAVALAVVIAAGKGHAQDADAGKKVFARCAACHDLEKGVNKVGPTLKGVLGRTAGLRKVRPQWQPARSGFAYAKPLGRTEFVPVRIVRRDAGGMPVLEMLGRGSSASLSAMALADGIALLPPDIGSVEPGGSLRFEHVR